jgi:hypothetical protein
MYTIITKENRCGGQIGVEPKNNQWTLTPYFGGLIKEFWNGSEWVESATPEEITQHQQSLVPQIITRRQFKIALAILGKNEQDILNGISQLPEPTRTIATISYTEAGTFERTNPELIFVGKMFLQMTDAQIDNIFIVGSQY